jgi:hypothetical protein
VRCALSLFGPGELQALHVADAGTLELVQFMLTQDGVPPAPAVQSLRALSVRGMLISKSTIDRNVIPALIERYAATITEVDCVSIGENGAADRALACCHRLESLSTARVFTPSAWLGLSQLHTLRGVSFADVPVATIAATLPRLRTLHAENMRRGHDFAVAEFFESLLPHLQSFHFNGWWPEDAHDAAPQSLVQLPSLQDFHWLHHDTGSMDLSPRALPRGFMGAHPVSLNVFGPAIAEWLTTTESARPGWAANGPFTRVRDLSITVGTLEAPDLARLLRAAPQLRRLTIDIFYFVEDDPLWLIARAPISDPAFAGLVHRRLRHLVVSCDLDEEFDDGAAAVVLQQRHFPRLRMLTVNDQQYPVAITG